MRPNEQLVRGRCVDKPIVAACKSNEKLVGGKCIGISIHCLPGYHQVGLKCVKNEKPEVSILCKPGFVLKGKTCVRKPEISILCKPGFVLKGKTCVRKPEVSILCARASCSKARPARGSRSSRPPAQVARSWCATTAWS